MINGQTVLGLITARGGSKGVPEKNIRMVGGKPLIAWTIEAGHASKYLDRLILSSDDDAIAEVAKSYGCEVPFKREARLAADDTPSIDAVLDALDRCSGYDWVVLLQPTSPLRTAEDIDGAVEKCLALGASACVSVCEAEQSPYWMYTIGQGERMAPLLPPLLPPFSETRRQDLPSAFALNGAVYVAKCDWIMRTKDFKSLETVAYVMPQERSVDVDSEEDIKRIDRILEESHPDITRDYIRENMRVHSLPVMGDTKKRIMNANRHSQLRRYLKLVIRDLRTGVLLYPLSRLRFISEYRKLREYKGSGRGRKALVLGNGPSQGYVTKNILQNFKNNGNDLCVVNFWNQNNKLSSVIPNNLIISDPATLKFEDTLNQDFFIKGKNIIEEKNLSLLSYIRAQREIKLFCPMERVVQIRALLPEHQVIGFNNQQILTIGNISPLFPRGYAAMTLFNALAITIFFDYEEIYVLGMDNTYPRDLYNNIDNCALNLEHHANGSYFCSVYGQDIASELFHLSNLFDDLKLFENNFPSRIKNLDPYSLTNAFEKASTIEVGLSRLMQ